eukprot:TRINITY_DN1895_c0_g1_i1.p1 TRINITY_DN1895_c0_g1~~TRINITY_DN1895_c0_g1_i1.p1  ORF type:complete len:294 (+),score=143.70 TRINITY_DN1895_c0_g1_i1:51-932(+)
MSQEAKALAHVAEAEKKKKGGWFSGPRFDEASESYSAAANCMKMAKNLEKAAEYFEAAAVCSIQSNNKYEGASLYVKAGECSKSNPKRKAAFYLKAIELYSEEGRFTTAAKYHKELAESFEEAGDIDNAIVHFEAAAELYDGDSSEAHGNQCKLKVAHLAAEKGDYKKAIGIFEETATQSLNNRIRKYNVKEYYLKAGICYLCLGDTVALRNALNRYRAQDYTFASQRESALLDKLIAAVDDFDSDEFSRALGEFNSISPMDNWKVDRLVKVKRDLDESKVEESLGDDAHELL